MKTVIRTLGLVLALTANAALATVTTFYDPNYFSTKDIGTFPSGFGGDTGSQTYAGTPIVGVTFSASEGLYQNDAWFDGTYGVAFLTAQTRGTSQTLTATYTGTAITAIGFSYGNSLSFADGLSTLQVTVTTLVGNEAPIFIDRATVPTRFIGFVSADKISSITFSQVTTSDITPMALDITQVIVGTAPVPEPSAYAMFAVGLALFGMIGRRRSRIKD